MEIRYENSRLLIKNNFEEIISKQDILAALESCGIDYVETPYLIGGWDLATLLYDKVKNLCFNLRQSDISFINEHFNTAICIAGRTPTTEDRERLADLLAESEDDIEETNENEEEEEMTNYGTCEHCGCVIETEYSACWFDDVLLCEECLDNDTRICDRCGERIWNDDDYGDSEITLCEYCRDNYYERCHHCGDLVYNDDVYWDESGDYPYCEDCYDKLNQHIHNYSYKPDPIFHGRGSMFMGVELEIDKAGTYDENAKQIIECTDSDHLYIKRDGSLNDGMELVTHPMTLAYHMERMPWEDIVDTAVHLGYRSHQTDTCGLHVHVNRSAFSTDRECQDKVIAKILYIVERFWQEFLKFSRRTEYQINHWAARYGIKDNPKQVMDSVKKENRGRYACVNLCNYNTIEFRIFRGTLKYNTLIATLQMVEHICQTAMNLSDEEITAMSWPEFIENIEYDELIQYLKERRLYINEPVENEEEM